MPKYRVLRPIEHNQQLFLPPSAQAPATAASVCHGQEIPVDASGVIELSEREAAPLVNGQTALMPEAPAQSEAATKKPKS